jgi:CubicO group peptidase (beta-lactamase class C family)
MGIMNYKSIFFILLILLFNACLKDEVIKLKYEGFAPVEINGDWEISTPEVENMNRELLNKAFELVYNENRFVMAQSLLVFRNGKLVAEAYPSDKNDISRLNNIQSITKSVTSMMVGVALEQNLLETVDEKLYDIYPNLFDDDVIKREITISDALTMRSGLKFDNDKHSKKLYSISSNSTRYVLSLARGSQPGTIVNYSDGDPHLISKAIEVKSGKSLAEFADENVFQKMGIDNWQWEAAKDGSNFGAFSLFLKPRDLGKIGQLLLNEGAWNNKQLIDSSFLKAAVSHQVNSNLNNQAYGYYLWLYPKWNAFAGIGHGGQFIFVAPDKNLVVVYTAWPYTGYDLWDDGEELMSIIYESCE